MATNNSPRRATSSSGGGSTPRPSTTGVSPARLQQKSGPSGAFGGYTKVNNGDGSFRMRKTGK
jgi:hypothetical protein